MMRHVTTVFADMDGLVSDVWETNPLFFFFFINIEILLLYSLLIICVEKEKVCVCQGLENI